MNDAPTPQDISRAILGLPYIGREPSGAWIGIGFAKKQIIEKLGISDADACRAIGDHLGRSVTFKFKDWSIAACELTEPGVGAIVERFSDADGAPNLSSGVYEGLFFRGGEIDNAAWSTGIFGGGTNPHWVIAQAGHKLRLMSFLARGALVDEVAIYSAFGIPHTAAVRQSETQMAAASGTGKLAALGSVRAQDLDVAILEYAASKNGKIGRAAGVLYQAMSEKFAPRIVTREYVAERVADLRAAGRLRKAPNAK
jgi:hypothetical protein